jgi:hypothetical protein
MELIMANYIGSKDLTLLERLLNKVIINQNTDCWEWQGGTNNIGYGMIRDEKKMRTAHRVSYEEHNNVKIPKLMCVCHTCDNPLCVNPNHLWLGSRSDNTRDMWRKGRANPFGGTTRLGKKQPRSTCNHCGKESAVNLISRWHNDNCKQKPTSINTTYTGQASP